MDDIFEDINDIPAKPFSTVKVKAGVIKPMDNKQRLDKLERDLEKIFIEMTKLSTNVNHLVATKAIAAISEKYIDWRHDLEQKTKAECVTKFGIYNHE